MSTTLSHRCRQAMVLATLSFTGYAQATSDTWDGSTSNLWSLNTNWANDIAAPGSGETATFNGAGNGNTVIDLGGGVTIGNIIFDTASAAAYTIGSTGQTLTFNTATGGNAVTLNSTVTTAQIINANILANSGDNTFRLVNSTAVTTGPVLTINGSISSGTAAAKTINVTGNVVVNNAITPGSAASVGVANVSTGTFTLSGNYTSTLNVFRASASGWIVVDGQTVSAATETVMGSSSSTHGKFELKSGTVSFNAGIRTNSSVNDGSTVKINAGSFSASQISLGRTWGSSTATSTTAVPTNTGFIVTGGTANITNNLAINGSNANASGLVSGGTLTVGGELRIADTTSTTRWNNFQVTGGTITVSGANGIVLARNGNGALQLNGGTTTTERVTFGSSTTAAGALGALYLNGANASLYVGSGGIAKDAVNAYTGTISLQNGTLGAKADWSTSLAMELGSGLTIKAAGADDVAHNITLGGALSVTGGNIAKTGAGTLILSGSAGSYDGNVTINAGAFAFDIASTESYTGVMSGAGSFAKRGAGALTLTNVNTYQGATSITAGNLVLASGASIANSATVSIASSTNFDVSASGYAVPAGQAIQGMGSVIGNAVQSNSTSQISPGIDTTKGTLGFSNDLTISGGKLSFSLTGGDFTAGTGVNDLLSVSGSLAASGSVVVAFDISGTPSNGTYTIASYATRSGTFDLSGWTVPVFARTSGTLIDNVASQTIDLQVTAVTGNLRWNGSGGSAQPWDVNTTSDWHNLGNSSSDKFYQYDSVLFDDNAFQSGVTVDTTVTPGAFVVDSSLNQYSITGGGTINGTSALVKNGTSVLTLGVANPLWTGGTTITAGTIKQGIANALPTTGGLNIGASGTLDLGGYGASLSDLTNNGTITNSVATPATLALNSGSGSVALGGTVIDGAGAVALNKTGTGTVVLSNNQTYTGGTTVSAGVLQVGAGATSGSFGPGAVVNNAALRINRSDNFTVANAISGTGSFTHAGTGTTVLTAANAYTGTTNVTSGTLQISGGNDRLPTATTVDVSTGAALDLNGRNQSVTGLTGTGVVTNTSAADSVLSVSGTSNYAGAINDGPTNKVGLAKTTAGILSLSGVSNYTGATTVNVARLRAENDSAFGQTSGITVSGNGWVYLANGVTINRTLYSSQTFGVLDVPDANATGTWSGNMGGGNNIRLHATGTDATLVLTGAINASNNGLMFVRGNFVLSGSGSAVSTGGTNAIGRDASGATSITLKDSYSVSMSNGTSLGGAQNTPSIGVTIQDNAVLTTGTSALDVLSTSSAANSSSTIQVNGGTLTSGRFSKSSVGANNLTTMNLNGGYLKFGGGSNGATYLPAHAGLTVNVQTGGAKFDTNGGDVTVGAVLNGSAGDGGLTKAAAGTLTLSGPNTYTGNTTINAGTLRVNGTHTGGGNYVVNANATLGGTGQITLASGKSLTVNASGKLAPGASIGVLTLDAPTVTLAADSNLIIEVDNSGGIISAADQLVIGSSASSITISGAELSFDFVSPTMGAVTHTTPVVIVNNQNPSTNITTDFKNMPRGENGSFAKLTGVLKYTLYYTYNASNGQTTGGNDIAIQFNAVPEPSSLGLMLGVGGLALRRRR